MSYLFFVHLILYLSQTITLSSTSLHLLLQIKFDRTVGVPYSNPIHKSTLIHRGHVNPVHPSFLPSSVRRSPLINRGYYSRVAALDKIIKQFIDTAHANGHKSQIVSLGAGFDTTYWRLKAHQGIACHYYVEVDFSSSISQKLQIIENAPVLTDILSAPNPNADFETLMQASDEESMKRSELQKELSADNIPPHGCWPDFAMVGGDLRDTDGLEKSLRALTRLDFDAPVLFLSECVLVYMPPHLSAKVIEWAGAGPFTGPRVFATYEQIHPNDPFGRTMVANLAARGCPLLGLAEYPDLEAQRKRFKNLGFSHHGAWSMTDVYRHFLDKDELRTIERLEMFDEFEEWHLIQGHYCISMAATEGKYHQTTDNSPWYTKNIGFLEQKPPSIPTKYYI